MVKKKEKNIISEENKIEDIKVKENKIEKLSPENAKGQTDRIWDAIRTLEQMPEAHQDRLVGRYAGKGYKQLIIDNYLVIYKMDNISKKVFVVTVQYQGRNI